MQRYFTIGNNADLFYLSEGDYHHIKNVMRFKVGSKIEVVFEKQLFLAEITDLEPLIIKKIKFLEKADYNKEIVVVIPFLRENKLDIFLQKATELGVDKIYFYEAQRSIVKMAQEKLTKKVVRWHKICKEASEQAKRLTIPEIIINDGWYDNLVGLKIMADPTSKKSLANYLKKVDNCDNINVLIGPEGGFTSAELKLYQNKGFTAINLGQNILRVETAPLYVLSVISYENMR